MFMKLGKGLRGYDSEQNKNIKIEIALMIDTPGTKPGYLMTKSIIINKENFCQNFNALFFGSVTIGRKPFGRQTFC